MLSETPLAIERHFYQTQSVIGWSFSELARAGRERVGGGSTISLSKEHQNLFKLQFPANYFGFNLTGMKSGTYDGQFLDLDAGSNFL